MEYKTHTHYEAARRAYAWTSHFPERRAETECAYFDDTCEKLKSAGKETAITKFETLFLKSLAAKSRCASSMITGPAKFPVERIKKYNRWEEAATKAMYDFVELVTAPPKAPRTEINYSIQANDYILTHEIWGEIKAKNNTEVNRLQLFFNGKPADDVITKLKQHGFKWSPRFMAWQRQLTPNAITALRYLNLKAA